MENLKLGPAEQGAVPAAPRRSGRTWRAAATIAASAVLLVGGPLVSAARDARLIRIGRGRIAGS